MYRYVSTVFRWVDLEAGPMGEMHQEPQTAAGTKEALSGKDGHVIFVQDEVGPASTFSTTYVLTSLESPKITIEVGDSAAGKWSFSDITENVRYDRQVSNISSLTRYISLLS